MKGKQLMSLASTSSTTPLELARHPLFTGLGSAVLRPLLDGARLQRCQRGQTISGPGAGPGLHLLLRGGLWLYELTTDGRRLILDRIGPGGVDGLVGLAGMESTFSEAAEPSEVASIPVTLVRRIVVEQPTLRRNLLAITLDQLRQREAQLRRIATRNPDQRIADQLLALTRKEKGPEQQRASVWWAPRFSHEALPICWRFGGRRSRFTSSGCSSWA